MAINIRMVGMVTDAVRSLTFTRSGLPRFRFGVRVGTVRPKQYAVTLYGPMARFADTALRTGQRIRVEGAYLRRSSPYEGLVRADMIRHVGRAVPPYFGTMVRFVPGAPPTPAAARPLAADADHRSAHAVKTARVIADAIAAAV